VLFFSTAGVIAAATLAIGVLTAVGPLFIALLLLPATRGLFAGWARSVIAAAIAPLLGWLTTILMLSVLEPWLVRLAQERAAAQLDAQTAMSVAALVFVFAAGQAALLVAAGVVAFGFRLRRPVAAEPTAASPVAERELAPVLSSRAERLAFDLLRDRAYIDARRRPAQIAAALAAGAASGAAPRDAPAERAARLGDAYRRPGVRGRRSEAAA